MQIVLTSRTSASSASLKQYHLKHMNILQHIQAKNAADFPTNNMLKILNEPQTITPIEFLNNYRFHRNGTARIKVIVAEEPSTIPRGIVKLRLPLL